MANRSREILLNLFNASIDFSIDFMENDKSFRVGPQSVPDVAFALKINDPNFYHAVLSYGNLGMGESFMKGGFEMIKGSLESFIESLLACRMDQRLKRNLSMTAKVLPFRLWSLLRGRQSNVRRHYDAGMDLFEAFLDPSLTYSCGYAENENDSLEQLQLNKYERICRKLDLQPRDHLLDIGCGFGGMLIYAAEHYSISGLGISNSKKHHEIGNERIKEKGLSHRLMIKLEDYKQLTGTYDKIVSIGMLEHVPENQYAGYCSTISQLLKENGKGLLHFVGANSHVNEHDYFIQKYIFPMSNQPRLSEITRCLEINKLPILDVENMIRHYGYTARHWLNNFRNNRDGLKGYSVSFLNMIEYYLACCKAAANASDAALYQVLFMKNHTSPISLRRV